MRARNSVWGLVDQGLSSITNFIGSLLAARMLSPSGFGAVAVGYSLYFIAVAISRAMVTDVLVVRCAAAPAGEQTPSIDRSLTGTLVVSGALAALILCAAPLMPAPSRNVLVLVAAALPFLLVQDVCRLALIMVDRSRSAAANDALWLVLTVAAFALFGDTATPSVSLALWIVGGVAAAAFGLLQLRARPVGPLLGWFRTHGRTSTPFLADALLILSSNYAFTVGIAVVAGSAEVAGLRGAQVLMGPLSVLFLGATVQAMPTLVRRAATSAAAARRGSSQLAVLFALAAFVVGAVLLLLPASVRRELLGATAGPAFALVPAMSCMFAALGCTMALSAGLKAAGAVRSMVRVRLVAAPLAVAGGIIGFAFGRSNGAVFGLAIGTFVSVPMWWRLLVRTTSAAA